MTTRVLRMKGRDGVHAILINEQQRVHRLHPIDNGLEFEFAQIAIEIDSDEAKYIQILDA